MAAALTTTVDCGFADGKLADPERFVGSLSAEFGAICDLWRRASGVGAAAVAAGVSGVARAADCLLGDAAVGFWVGDAVASAEGTSASVRVASADAVVSLLGGVELVCASSELCSTPEGGSAVEASVGEKVELAWSSTELFLMPDVEPDEEPAAGADEFVDEGGSVDDVLAADSDAELEADDDEPDDELEEADDELEELVSVGSANATAGVFATAAPTPSANANAPARTMYCAFTGIALSGQPARAPAECPPEPA